MIRLRKRRPRAPYIPGFSQGTPEPKHLRRHSYGAAGTIHQTGTIDIQVNDQGHVVAVWFRCLNLPFTVSALPGPPDDSYPIQPGTAIETITYVDREHG